MVAIYTIDSELNGLNFHGAETFLFQAQPSCFTLRINNTYILNMSWDFMCSPNCGFPFPKKIIYDLDRGADGAGSGISVNKNTSFPILESKIIKPTILLYQPIISKPLSINDFDEFDCLKSKIISGSSNMGILFRQFKNKLEELYDLDMLIEYDEVTGDECRSVKDIVIQNYKLQLESYLSNKYRSINQDKMNAIKAMKNQFSIEINQIISEWEKL